MLLRSKALLAAVKICQDLLGQNRFLMVKDLKPQELVFLLCDLCDSVVNAFKVKGFVSAVKICQDLLGQNRSPYG